jgi:hypothetical protein
MNTRAVPSRIKRQLCFQDLIADSSPKQGRSDLLRRDWFLASLHVCEA